ncbi:9800_t:CDS:2 [Entrophospora sp. SA101]|nr:9800_t:CDS:2 [Entrophospora sp. SA101]
MESPESSFFSYSPSEYSDTCSLICSSPPLYINLTTQTLQEIENLDIQRISKFFNLPIELLTEIFLYLPPETLYHLTLTPKNMSEQQYIWLKIIVLKCQYCNHYMKNELMCGIGIYWEFKLFSCDNCIKLNTISYEKLINEWKIPQKLLYCLPSINYLTYKDYLLASDYKNRYDNNNSCIYSSRFYEYHCFIYEEEYDDNNYYCYNFNEEYDRIKSDYERDQWIRIKHKEIKEYLEDVERLIMEDYKNFCSFS